MRMFVTGRQGQLVRSLVDAADDTPVTVVPAGRPQLDLTDAAGVQRFIADAAPDVVVNAAAYTAVDLAETEPDAAYAINELGARAVAAACASRDIPIIHISTDYVFSGDKPIAYVETDQPAPQGVYGASKLAGERAVAAANAQHIILRTAWLYSPYGKNFVKTMLRLAESRDDISVVSDQIGSPTYAPHLANAILALTGRITSSARANVPWGIYHAAGTDTANWYELACETFAAGQRCGMAHAKVTAISTADYPTPARRPKNSRLNCSKMAADFDIVLPRWQVGVVECVERLAGRD